MHVVQIQPNSLVRIPKFEVQLAPPTEASGLSRGLLGQTKLRRSLLPDNLSVARLYDMIFCVHIETELEQVHLYQLFKDFVVRKYVLAVYSRKAQVSVSDNLLIVHALDSKVALIFDLRINTQYPITAPLPIATVAADGFSPLYSPHWSLAPPSYVIDPQAGRVGLLELDLHTIARSSIDKACLLQFLLTRTYSGQVIMDTFAKSIEEEEGLSVLARMFDLMHAVVARNLLQRRAFGRGGASTPHATPTATTSAGPTISTSDDAVTGMPDVAALHIVSPELTPVRTPHSSSSTPGTSAPMSERTLVGGRHEMEGPPDSDTFVAYVFEQAIKKLRSPADAKEPRRRYLLAALTEYLHSRQQHALPLDERAGNLVLSMLEAQRSYYQLHQFVQYHLVPDSMDLAYRLLSLEPEYPPAAELALDMFKRLGPLGSDALTGCLLERGQLLAACRFIRSNGLKTFPPRPLLQAAAARKDGIFAAVFNFFRQRNEVWRHSPHFLPEEQCEEYVALWEARYSDQADAAHEQAGSPEGEDGDSAHPELPVTPQPAAPLTDAPPVATSP
jgi:hypothetical protein